MKRSFLPVVCCLALSALSLFTTNTSLTYAQKRKPPAATPTCPRPDADLVKTVYDKFKADTQFKDQLKQINVTAKDGEVKLQGWVRGGGPAVQRAAKLAQSVACVKSVRNKLSPFSGGGCDTATQKECGKLCIDINDDCNISN